MTQYMFSVVANQDDAMPPEDEIQAMYASVDAFNTELRAAGRWVFAGGLHPISSATVVDGTDVQAVVTDGPYAESKEYLGGFWVIEAADLDEALDLATKGSRACGAKIEVRPFQEA